MAASYQYSLCRISLVGMLRPIRRRRLGSVQTANVAPMHPRNFFGDFNNGGSVYVDACFFVAFFLGSDVKECCKALVDRKCTRHRNPETFRSSRERLQYSSHVMQFDCL